MAYHSRHGGKYSERVMVSGVCAKTIAYVSICCHGKKAMEDVTGIGRRETQRLREKFYVMCHCFQCQQAAQFIVPAPSHKMPRS